MNNKYTITIEDEEGRKLIGTTPWDTDIWGWSNIFKSLLTWLTFGPELIQWVMRNEDDDETSSTDCFCFEKQERDCKPNQQLDTMEIISEGRFGENIERCYPEGQ